MREYQIKLELGHLYRVTYDNGSVKTFSIIGGPNPMVRLVSENGTADVMDLSSLLVGFRTIEKIVNND